MALCSLLRRICSRGEIAFTYRLSQLQVGKCSTNLSGEHLRSIARHSSTIGFNEQQQNWKYLTDDQVEHYHKHGYLVVQNLLSSQQLQECREAIEYLRETADPTDSDLEFGPTGLLERVRFPSEKHSTFWKLIRADNLLDCIEDLIGGSIRYIPQDKLNCKPAGGGASIPWHQDWAHFPHTNDSVLTACVLFSDSSRANGCLQVIPGSHRGPIYSHHIDGKFCSLITDPNFDSSKRVYLEAPAGSVTIHNARLAHGSAGNNSTVPRHATCFIYTAMDAWPLLGVGDHRFGCDGPVDYDAFTKTLVRGEASLNVRMEANPVLLPAPFQIAYSVIDGGLPVAEPEP